MMGVNLVVSPRSPSDHPHMQVAPLSLPIRHQSLTHVPSRIRADTLDSRIQETGQS